MGSVNINKLRWYSNSVQPKYPHLRKREAKLWTSFIRQFGNRWLQVAYDVPVSSLVPFYLHQVHSVESNWEYLTSLKIDCLVKAWNGYTLFELKPVFDVKAIGQVYVYKELLPLIFGSVNPLSMAIVTESASDDFLAVCKTLGIKLYIEDRSFNE